MRAKGSSLAVAAAFVAGAIGMWSGAGIAWAEIQPAAAHATSAGLPDFSALVARVGPAVVNITTTAAAAGDAQQQAPFDPNDPLYQFFRRFQIPVPRPLPEHGIGSGFIISPDGYILTNAHVVDNATDVNVKLTDRREFKAKVVGKDDRTDVALLKIDASGLPTLTMGDPSKVKVGQWVVAVGSPFGFDNSVTAGIVSAKSRSLNGAYVPFIQTDVPVNPGNSGGPLFNMDGEVIGINSQIYSRTGGYMGLSFAIPIDIAMHVKDDLQRYGKVSHGRIGVVIQSVDQDLAQSFGLKKPMGALVSSVDEQGPAAHAGIKQGDIIIAFDGKTIENSTDLPRLVGETKPGQPAKLRIWRDGSEHELNLTVGAMPDEQLASSGGPGESNAGKLGLAVRPLSKEEKEQMHVASGLMVEHSSGAAAKAGIQPGDVVLALGDKPVSSPEELRKLVDKAGKHVALLVQREETKTYISVDIG